MTDTEDHTSHYQERLKNATSATIRALGQKPEAQIKFTGSPLDEGRPGLTESVVRVPLRPDLERDSRRERLRGAADAASMRLAFHNPRLHQKLAPRSVSARMLFDALEQTRIEALGSNLMPGVGQNLTRRLQDELSSRRYANARHKAQTEFQDALCLLCREILTGNAPPEEGRDIVQSLRAEIQKRLPHSALASLRDKARNQNDFAETALSILRDLGYIAPDEKTEEDSESQDQQSPQDGKDQPEMSEGQSPEPSSDTQKGQDGDTETASDEGQSEAAGGIFDMLNPPDKPAAFRETPEPEDDPESQPGLPGLLPGQTGTQSPEQDQGQEYRVYTREFDEILPAAKLARPDELERLRETLDKQLTHFQSVIAKLANRLQRRLMARQKRAWLFDQESGILDPARLSRIVVDPAFELAFKRESEAPFKDTVVSLLIDNSGSMRGRPITIAALSADILARSLERCGIRVEILGFTTRAWKGGRAREKWAQNQRPGLPGRLNDLRHIIYKSADAPWRRTRRNLGLMLKEGLLKENIDGEALLWAARRLIARSEQRKVLIVISDGAPVDDSTLSANGPGYLEQHLHHVINHLESRQDLELTAIGIGHNVSRYYSRAITIANADELGQALTDRLSEIFDVR